ncbi:MAG TPA: ATP-binding protein [Verrucomicrobiae bacterium]|nr:ATP-binding protein [Verrucomicrobiae bacterium]
MNNGSSDLNGRVAAAPGPRWPEPRRIPGLNTRLPLFEFALLLVAAALGYAAFRTYGMINLSKREPDTTQDARDIGELLKLHSLMEVKERYALLADHLENGVAELRESLLVYLRDKDRGEIGRFRGKSQALEAWLRKQPENTDARKHGMLQEWLATLPPGQGSVASNAINLEIEELYARAARSFSNYLATVPLPEGKPITPDLVQKKLVKAAQPEMELLGVARQARDQAAAIELFVERRPAELAHQAKARAEREGMTSFFNLMKGGLQPLFYLLVMTLIVQCVLLIMGLYGRFVVLPLRQKMIEDTSAVEHQKKLNHFARLATGLAHEIRNPLTAINVRLFTLQKVLKDDSTEQADAVLIRNEIDRLEQILKNFLKLARPTEPKFAKLTAEPALREVRDLLGPHLQRHNIELKLEQMAETRFEADPVQLKQVLINLIQNAADAIGRRGTITLRARQDQVRIAGRPTPSVVLEVQDTGHGISPEVQERLFDPFFSTKDNGTGLGLPIAMKIIDQHQGLLDFDSREGHGSTFRVILPVSNQPN